MKTITLCLTLGLLLSFNLKATNFKKYFKEQTMRFDYFHIGNSKEEHFAFDRAVSDGEWAGSKIQLIDELRLGKYFFEVISPNENKVVYSRGFSSIYGEWETTGDAKKNWGSIHESLRFPWPKEDVKLVLYKRNEKNDFIPIWEYSIDLSDYRINPVHISNMFKSKNIVVNGPSQKKVDIVLLGEGYTKEEMPIFQKHAKRFAEVLLSTEPFKSMKDHFNIRAVETPSPKNGVNHPHQDIYKRSALSVSYSAMGSQRYALGLDNKKIRDAAATVPYEFTAILMNDSIYGGGGIYNLYITAAAKNAFQEYLFVHEFGHHFADLADEYYTSSTAYEVSKNITEPWELNVTTNLDPKTIKWKALLSEETPIPTPWQKEKYDKQSILIQKKRKELRNAKAPENVMEKLFFEKRDWDEKLLGNMKYSNKVGAFEGAHYRPKGVYRSAPNCIMFTRHNKFCPACQRAIRLVINQYIK